MGAGREGPDIFTARVQASRVCCLSLVQLPGPDVRQSGVRPYVVVVVYATSQRIDYCNTLHCSKLSYNTPDAVGGR